MSFYDLVKPILFSLDPEVVHEKVVHFLASGALSARPYSNKKLKCKAMGLEFSHPIGLAAGFDKNGIGVHSWELLGFSFAEIGTVTAIPQVGNTKPRLFRLPEDSALINRMGFNNDGCEVVAKRLEQSYSRRGKPTIPIGINIGKSKVVPLEKANLDYEKSFRALKEFGDYVVVNVSSPNTPGLRNLQTEDALKSILGRLKDIDDQKPLLVKIAPDLPNSEVESNAFLDSIASVSTEMRLAGVIATNTTISRENLNTHFESGFPEGGLSGVPLFEKSTQILRELRLRLPAEMTLIGVGGISTAEHLKQKLNAGAQLTQVYTGWVYGGADFVTELLQKFVSDVP